MNPTQPHQKLHLILLSCITASLLPMLCTAQDENPYRYCCTTEAITYEFREYRVYIPNIITPNGDGLNDVFCPLCNVMNNDSFAVASMMIRNEAGDVIWYAPGVDIENAEHWGFSGTGHRNPVRPVASLAYEYTGRFTYSCTLAFRTGADTEELIEVNGEGCVVRCDEAARILADRDQCYYPEHWNGNEFAPEHTPEDDCVKP